MESLANTKSQLITNPTPSVATNEPLKYRLEHIDKRVTQIKEEIFGRYKKTVINLSFLYEPEKTGIITLLEVHPKNGIYIPSLNSTNPIRTLLSEYIINRPEASKDFKALTINVEKASEVNEPKNKFTNSKTFGPHFLVYNIPEKYSIQIYFDTKPLKSFSNSEDEKGTDIYDIYFPQKGYMAAFPYDFKDMKVTFYEDLGAIKDIKYSKIATIDATKVTAGFAGVDSLISLRNRIKESRKVEDDTEEVQEQVIRLIIQNDTSQAKSN